MITCPQTLRLRRIQLPTVGSLLFSLCLSIPILAQEQASSPDATTELNTEDDMVVLTPFEVTADQDNGYQAVTTLAGGRIQTQLKDTPATISIITKEFMDDLGLNSTVDFSEWAPNAETAYADGGFLDEYRTSTRGLSPSFGSRNYFRSYSSGDTYNTERVEFARGPNALLFGDASIGGITTIWTKQARLNRRIAEIKTKFDSFGSMRGSVDYNLSASPVFAIRANAVLAVNESWRDIEESDLRALHLATTIGITRNTQLRVEGEYSEKSVKVPFSRILDQASNFLRLTPEQREAAAWSGPRSSAFPTGTTRFTDRLTVIESMPELGVLNWVNRGRSTGSGVSLIPGGRADIEGFPTLPSRKFNPNAPGADLYYETTTASIYLDQRVGEDLFLQVAYNYSLPENERDEVRWDDAYVDVNRFIPEVGNPAVNGRENPYFGQIFSDEESKLMQTKNELHEYRAMAAWKFENSWTTQSFSALVSQRTDQYGVERFRQVPRGIKSGTAENPVYYSSNSTADLIYHRRYWNDLSGDYRVPDTFTNRFGEVLPVEWRQYEDTRNETTLTAFQIANVGKYFDGRLSVVTGYRYDKYDRTDSTLVTRAGATSPDNGKPLEVILDPTKRLVQTESSPSVGGVFWLFKGLGLSANYAESFNLATTGSPDLFGRPIGPSNATGKEFGLRFDLFDSRLTGSLLRYENTQTGAALTPSAGEVRDRINAIWAAVDTTRTLEAFRDVQGTEGSGWEAELVYNPIRSWKMRFALGVPRVEAVDRLPNLKAYIAGNRGLWEGNGGLATGRSGSEATVAGTLAALDLYVTNNYEDGMRNTGAYKWNASYFTSYKFLTGSLNGFSIGAGARYTGERFVGRTSAPDASGVNQYTEYWNEDVLLLNAMMRYEFKLNRRPASVQVNIDNLLDNDDLIYRNINTSGGVTRFHSYTWITPRRVSLSATLHF